MKTLRTMVVAAVGLAVLGASVPVAVAEGKADAVRKGGFLGVVTTPVNEAVASHLDLPPGVGLAVVHVEKDSPADGVLREYDVLTKVDDQLLVNGDQFATLIRNHKGGDKVELTVVRKGKPLTVTATLAERELPVMSHASGSHDGDAWADGPGWVLPPPVIKSFAFPEHGRKAMAKALKDAGLDDEAIEEFFERMGSDDDEDEDDDDEDDGAGWRIFSNGKHRTGRIRIQPHSRKYSASSGKHATSVQIRSQESTRVATSVQNGRTMTLTQSGDDGLHLRVVDEDGKELFDGPVKDDVPEKFREQFEELQELQKGIKIEQQR